MSRGGTGLYATMATRTSDRFPAEYLERTVGDLKTGEHSVIPATSLIVDSEMRCWLRPDVVCETDRTALNTTSPCITIWREDKGYVVGLHTCKAFRWRISPSPDLNDGIGWIPVVEVRY
jgi:hypothetical protein